MLDLREERKYTRLKKMAGELHLPMCEVFWTLEVFDKDGKLLQSHHQRSHSWVRNAYNLLFCQFACTVAPDNTYEGGKLSIKRTDGTIDFDPALPVLVINTLRDPDSAGHGYLANAADDNHGILVGSGTNVESFEDYVLQTPIAEGAGGGQLNHIESEPHDVSYAGLTLKDEQVRYFNNNSGGNVLVNEVALVTEGYIDGGEFYWVQSRDKLAGTVTVPDTGQLKVTYTISLTYPS